MDPKAYQNPLTDRYASQEMVYLFSPEKKFTTWRHLWLALAEAESHLGLPISPSQLKAMRETLNDVDFPLAAAYERNSDTMSWHMCMYLVMLLHSPDPSFIWVQQVNL